MDRHWRGFGVIAVAFIALWSCWLAETYFQRQIRTENMLADLSPLTPFIRVLLIGVMALPFAFYIAIVVFKHRG